MCAAAAMSGSSGSNAAVAISVVLIVSVHGRRGELSGGMTNSNSYRYGHQDDTDDHTGDEPQGGTHFGSFIPGTPTFAPIAATESSRVRCPVCSNPL